jgi:hypothetical protein
LFGALLLLSVYPSFFLLQLGKKFPTRFFLGSSGNWPHSEAISLGARLTGVTFNTKP